MVLEYKWSIPIRRTLRLVGGGGKVNEVKIEYEFNPPQCANCNVFGHDEQRCLKMKVVCDVVNK